jgi:integrase/recombinase XerC
MTITGPDARTGAPGQAVVDAAMLVLERMGLTPPTCSPPRRQGRRPRLSPSTSRSWRPWSGTAAGRRTARTGTGWSAMGRSRHRRAHAIGDPPARPARPGQRRAPAELPRRAERRRAPHRRPALHVQAPRRRRPDQPGRQPRPESREATPPAFDPAGGRRQAPGRDQPRSGDHGDDPKLDTLLLRLHTETACRRGGALALRPQDLDPEQCLILLREKGETIRWQPVSPTLMAALLGHAGEHHASACTGSGTRP